MKDIAALNSIPFPCYLILHGLTLLLLFVGFRLLLSKDRYAKIGGFLRFGMWGSTLGVVGIGMWDTLGVLSRQTVHPFNSYIVGTVLGWLFASAFIKFRSSAKPKQPQ